MHTEPTSPPPSRRIHPSRLRTWLAAPLRSDLLWLTACVLAMLAILQLVGVTVEHFLPPRSTVREHFTPSGIEQAGNELLYRACVREARMHSLPVMPYPQESENISFVHEGALLVKRTETQEADINDMSVENGCQVKLRSSVRTETASTADLPSNLRQMRQGRNADNSALTVPVGETNSEAPRCTFQRDMALQSHYMLLKLCSIERKPTAAHPDEAGRKPTRSLRQPTT